MSVVSGSGACRMTLGTLASRYGYELVPPSSEGVTVTSLADEVDSVIPGSLYVPAGSVNMERLEHAAMRGADAALVPHALRGAGDRLSMPLVLGECDDVPDSRLREACATACDLYGCVMDERGKAVGRTAESDALARQADEGEHGGSWEVLSLAIAMAMAAGVRRANIRSALRVSRELS